MERGGAFLGGWVWEVREPLKGAGKDEIGVVGWIIIARLDLTLIFEVELSVLKGH